MKQQVKVVKKAEREARVTDPDARIRELAKVIKSDIADLNRRLMGIAAVIKAKETAWEKLMHGHGEPLNEQN